MRRTTKAAPRCRPPRGGAPPSPPRPPGARAAASSAPLRPAPSLGGGMGPRWALLAALLHAAGGRVSAGSLYGAGGGEAGGPSARPPLCGTERPLSLHWLQGGSAPRVVQGVRQMGIVLLSRLQVPWVTGLPLLVLNSVRALQGPRVPLLDFFKARPAPFGYVVVISWLPKAMTNRFSWIFIGNVLIFHACLNICRNCEGPGKCRV